MSRKSGATHIAHERSCMDGCKIDRKHPPRNTLKRLLRSFSLTHEPHEHVILYVRKLGKHAKRN